jgi:hypothetical protein
MSVKASAAYDRAGLKTTKLLVTHLREFFGRTVPDSLRGEPSSLSSDTYYLPPPASGKATTTRAKKRHAAKPKKIKDESRALSTQLSR